MLPILLAFGSAPALALVDGTNCFTSGVSGIADAIDAGNANKSDDALVCVDEHIKLGSVNSSITFQNEIANTAAHEMGHLVGLVHADGTATSLMNGAYNGTVKTFSTAAEQAKLNALAGNQVVWLDFSAASPGLPAGTYAGFASSPRLGDFGITTPAQIAAAITNIASQITADYAGPWTGGATFTFVTAQPVAGAYSTVSFVSLVPEPSTGVLLLVGFAALTFWRRSHAG